MGYGVLKDLHMGSVALSWALFTLRGVWMLADSPRLLQRWARVLPHVVDTVLLASALALAWTIGQYPFVHGWLTAKVFGLIAYIVLGTVALKRGKTKAQRAAAWVAAQATFLYIVSAAATKNPVPWSVGG